VNKERLVFLGSIVVCGALAAFGVRLEEVKKGIVRSAELLAEQPRPKEIRFLGAAELWAPGSRDAFEEPRDIAELPGLDLPLPDPREMSIVRVPPFPRPHPSLWSALEAPRSLTVTNVGEDPVETDPNDLAGQENGETPAEGPSGATASTSSLDSPPDPATIYDRVSRDGRILYGHIRHDDPRSLIAGELDGEANRYLLVPGASLGFEQVNLRSGNAVGAVTFRPADLEWFSLAETADNLYFARARLLRDNDFTGRADLARWAMEVGRSDLAETALLEAIRIAPDRSDLRVALARARRARFDWDGELACLDEAIGAGVSSGTILARRAAILDLFGLESEAEEGYRSALSAYPDNEEAAAGLAHLLLARGDTDTAIDLLRRAEGLAQGAGEARRRAAGRELAIGLLQSGRLSEARTALDRATQLDGVDPESLVLRGMMRYLDGDGASALGLLDQVDLQAGLFPDATMEFALVLNRGLAALLAGDAERARRELLSAARLHPSRSAASRVALAQLELLSDRKEQCFDHLERALAADPDDPYTLYLLGKFHSMQGNHEEARSAFERALLRAPSFSQCLAELSRSCYFLEKWDEGVHFCRAAAEAMPARADLPVLAALHLLRLRRVSAARAQIDLALGKDENDPTALALEAVILYQSGGEEEVLRSLDSFQRAATAAESRGDAVTAAFARELRTAIEENRSKVRWTDDFNRRQIKRDWIVTERYGIRVQPEADRIHFHGVQNQDAKVTSLARDFPHRRLVSFQADLEMRVQDKASFGLMVARVQRDEIRDGLFFGRDADGALQYTVVRTRSGSDAQGESVSIDGARWPAGTVRLGVELLDLKEGRYRLLVDGEPLTEIQVPGLKNAPSVQLGVYGRAGIGARWEAWVDDADVVMRKE